MLLPVRTGPPEYPCSSIRHFAAPAALLTLHSLLPFFPAVALCAGARLAQLCSHNIPAAGPVLATAHATVSQIHLIISSDGFVQAGGWWCRMRGRASSCRAWTPTTNTACASLVSLAKFLIFMCVEIRPAWPCPALLGLHRSASFCPRSLLCPGLSDPVWPCSAHPCTLLLCPARQAVVTPLLQLWPHPHTTKSVEWLSCSTALALLAWL